VGVLLLLVVGGWIVGVGSPADAAIILNPNQGPTGTPVSVTVPDAGDIANCRLLFDGAELARVAGCAAGLSFVVPGSAAAGGLCPESSDEFRVLDRS